MRDEVFLPEYHGAITRQKVAEERKCRFQRVLIRCSGMFTLL